MSGPQLSGQLCLSNEGFPFETGEGRIGRKESTLNSLNLRITGWSALYHSQSFSHPTPKYVWDNVSMQQYTLGIP